MTNECFALAHVVYGTPAEGTLRADGRHWCDRHWAEQSDPSLDEEDD